MTLAHGHGQNVGEVVLALRVRIAHARQVFREQLRGIGKHSRIDLPDRALRFIGILVLDHAAQAAGLVAKHAAVARGIVKLGREKCRGLPRERLEGRGLQQGHVTVENEHRGGFLHAGHSLQNCVPRAQLFRLHHPGEVGRVERRLNPLCTVADHHVDAPRGQTARRSEHVREKRSSGERVQHLREIRAHPRSLPGGEDYDFERHVGRSVRRRL